MYGVIEAVISGYMASRYSITADSELKRKNNKKEK
jgi:hypothetical protein